MIWLRWSNCDDKIAMIKLRCYPCDVTPAMVLPFPRLTNETSKNFAENKCTDIWIHFSTGKGDRLGDSYKGNFVDGQVRNFLFDVGKDCKISKQWIFNSFNIKIVFPNFFIIFGRILEADFFTLWFPQICGKVLFYFLWPTLQFF